MPNANPHQEHLPLLQSRRQSRLSKKGAGPSKILGPEHQISA